MDTIPHQRSDSDQFINLLVFGARAVSPDVVVCYMRCANSCSDLRFDATYLAYDMLADDGI